MITSQSNTFSQRPSPRFTGVVIGHNPYSRETGDQFLDQNQPRSIVHFDIFTDQFIKSKVQYDNQKLASKIATEWDNILKDWPPSPISDKNLWDKSDSYFKDRCKILINESPMPCKQKQISLHVLDQGELFSISSTSDPKPSDAWRYGITFKIDDNKLLDKRNKIKGRKIRKNGKG